MTDLNPIERTYRRLTSEGRAPLKLFQGNPTLHGIHFPQEILQEAYAKALTHARYEPDPKGRREAREAVARYYAEQGWEISPRNIQITCGTSESFFYLFGLLARPGDHFLAPVPTYPLFEHLAHAARVGLRYYRLEETRNWAIHLDQLKSLADERTRGVILISPHNPTGAVAAEAQLEPLVTWCNEKNLPLICDEVFAPFYFGEHGYPRAAARMQPELCFCLNGISKLLALPGLKLGWMTVTGKKSKTEGILDPLETLADTFLSVHDPVQRALPTLLQESRPFQRDYQNEVRRRWDKARTQLRTFAGLEWVDPVGGYYVTVRVKDSRGRNEEKWIIELMEQQGVFVHPGYFFDLEEGLHFVFTFLTDPGLLERGLDKIKAFIEGG